MLRYAKVSSLELQLEITSYGVSAGPSTVISQINISAADGSTTNPSTGDFAKSRNSFLILVVAIFNFLKDQFRIKEITEPIYQRLAVSVSMKRENDKKS